MGASNQIDGSEIFLDTSVLVDFVQKASSADCFPIFKTHPCDKTVSTTVREEYRKKRENREYIVRRFQEQIGQGSTDFSELDVPHKDRFSDSDEDYAKELLSELAKSDEQAALRELAKRRKLFKKGSRFLFGEEVGILDIYKVEDLNEHLLGNLRRDISNRDDRHIIAEAAEWAMKRGKETLVSEDRRDFVGNENQINDSIDLTRGFERQLLILTSAEFLHKC